ncbi:MAG: hypothetical protein IGS38_12730 [Synechococcales cyanobacterium M58_A2018_015]|nr:hypothetical protein [Synechococcales cyanobacterium M58_A2018_015]
MQDPIARVNKQADLATLQQAARRWQRTGMMTVIAQDHAPIHTSHAVRARIPLWQLQGLYSPTAQSSRQTLCRSRADPP